MSGIYYVLVQWTPSTYTSGATLARSILCFSSRYDADEYYRELQVVTYGGSQFFTSLSRSSPQFWTYDSTHLDQAVLRLFSYNVMPKFKNVSFANSNQEKSWNFFPNSVTGPDWLSGGTYFIRNRRQPNLYWWVHDAHIHTSEQRRSKFRIQQVTPSENRTGECCKPVLIRKDDVHIDVVPETATSAAVQNGAQFVSIRATKNKSNCIFLENKPYSWIFEDLVTKNVGVRWGDEIPDEKGEGRPLVVFMPNGGGDEWELC